MLVGSKKSKNTSVKKLIKKRYYIINYLKEYVIWHLHQMNWWGETQKLEGGDT